MFSPYQVVDSAICVKWKATDRYWTYARICRDSKARIGAVKDYEATLDTKTIIKESIKEDEEEN